MAFLRYTAALLPLAAVLSFAPLTAAQPCQPVLVPVQDATGSAGDDGSIDIGCLTSDGFLIDVGDTSLQLNLYSTGVNFTVGKPGDPVSSTAIQSSQAGDLKLTTYTANNYAAIRLAYAGVDGMVVGWSTAFQLTNLPTVKYGINGLTNTATGGTQTYGSSYYHYVKISGLPAHTTYQYQIQADPQGPLVSTIGGTAGGALGGDAGTVTGSAVPNVTSGNPYGSPASDQLTFTTARAPGTFDPHTVLMVGDWGTTLGFNTHDKLVDAIKSADFLLHTGDISYADDFFLQPPDTYEDIFDKFQTWLTPITNQHPHMVMPGNHEAACNEVVPQLCPPNQQNFVPYRNRFRMPSQESGAGDVQNMWSSFDNGMVHYIALNSETDYVGSNNAEGPGGRFTGTDFGGTNGIPSQVDWLEADLAAVDRTKTPWVIASMHRPMYSSSNTGPTDTSSNNSPALLAAFEDLFLKYHVDLMLSGHQHYYERLYPIAKGVPITSYEGLTTCSPPVYIVNGAAGNVEAHSTADQQGITAFLDETHYGYGILDFLSESQLKFTYIDSASGNAIDSVTLTRTRVDTSTCSGSTVNTTTTVPTTLIPGTILPTITSTTQPATTAAGTSTSATTTAPSTTAASATTTAPATTASLPTTTAPASTSPSTSNTGATTTAATTSASPTTASATTSSAPATTQPGTTAAGTTTSTATTAAPTTAPGTGNTIATTAAASTSGSATTAAATTSFAPTSTAATTSSGATTAAATTSVAPTTTAAATTSVAPSTTTAATTAASSTTSAAATTTTAGTTTSAATTSAAPTTSAATTTSVAPTSAATTTRAATTTANPAPTTGASTTTSAPSSSATTATSAAPTPSPTTASSTTTRAATSATTTTASPAPSTAATTTARVTSAPSTAATTSATSAAATPAPATTRAATVTASTAATTTSAPIIVNLPATGALSQGTSSPTAAAATVGSATQSVATTSTTSRPSTAAPTTTPATGALSVATTRPATIAPTAAPATAAFVAPAATSNQCITGVLPCGTGGLYYTPGGSYTCVNGQIVSVSSSTTGSAGTSAATTTTRPAATTTVAAVTLPVVTFAATPSTSAATGRAASTVATSPASGARQLNSSALAVCATAAFTAPKGATDAFTGTVVASAAQTIPVNAYITAAGQSTTVSTPSVQSTCNGVALQCPVQYDGPRAPLGVQDYVCYVYDPQRAEAPWAGSSLAYPQCYNPDEQTCTATNLLCPVAAPLACGRACFSASSSQCVVDSSNFFNSKLVSIGSVKTTSSTVAKPHQLFSRLFRQIA